MDPAIADTPSPTPHARMRFEVILASAWLAIGLFALPAAIYLVGVVMLGPYKPGAGLIQFYTDFFGDLAQPTMRAWVIALGPLILTTLIRVTFWGVPARDPEKPSIPMPIRTEDPPESKPKTRERVEPRISSE
jgi:hypothetical protein